MDRAAAWEFARGDRLGWWWLVSEATHPLAYVLHQLVGRACVRVGRGENDWLDVLDYDRAVCCHHGCSNMYMDGVVREANARVQGEGLVMLGKDGGSGG